MDQIFRGTVGQVAGGHINNYGPITWDQLPTEELYRQRQRYRSLLWAARRRMLFNLPNLISAVTMLGALVYALYSLTQLMSGQLDADTKGAPIWAIISYAIFGIGLPVHFSIKARDREAAIISDCRAHLRAIDIALNRR